ncbi:hypothetical protein ACE6H2_006723 [Prunus campanulata]
MGRNLGRFGEGWGRECWSRERERFIFFKNFVRRHFCPCQIGLVHATSSFLTEKLTEMTERTISENGGIIKLPP